MRKTGKMTKILAGVILGLGLLTCPALAADVPQETAAPYTINAHHWSREDFSQAANPTVFTEVFDRDLYNAIRQTLVDESKDDKGEYAYTMVSQEDYGEVANLVGRLYGKTYYKHYVPSNLANYYAYLDYYALQAYEVPEYQTALEYIQPIIEKTQSMTSDKEKVTLLNDYLCSLLTYDRKSVAGITQIFASHNEEVKGACGAYSTAFQFLCSAADIPSFTITSQNHAWNMVYADGRWLHVDVSANDHYKQKYILMKETIDNRIDENPEATAFLQELLVPGSTK